MAVELRVPKLGIEMTHGTIVEWIAEEGNPVAKGDPLYLLGTDKIETQVESPSSGVLSRVAEEGADYQVGDLVGYLE